jgi:hypothetical protein
MRSALTSMMRAFVWPLSVTMPAWEPVAEVVDHHRGERAGHALAGRKQHVHLAWVGPV